MDNGAILRLDVIRDSFFVGINFSIVGNRPQALLVLVSDGGHSGQQAAGADSGQQARC